MSEKIAEAYVEISARLDKMHTDLNRARTDFTRSADQMQAKADSLSGSIANIKSAYAMASAFIAGAFVSAIAGAIKSTADHLDQLDEMSVKTGVSVEMLTSLELAAKQNSVSMEKLATSIRMMYRSMYEANGGSKEAADAYKRLGVEIKDAQGNLKSGNDAFLEVADAISKIKNPAEKSALAMKVFGRAGAEMIPMLQGGRKALQGYIDEAKRLGLVITSEDAARGAAFNDMLDAFTKSLTRLKEIISMWPMEQMTKIFAMLTGSELPGAAKQSVRQTQIKNVIDDISAAQAKILSLEDNISKNKSGESLFGLDTPALEKELAKTSELLRKLYNEYLFFEEDMEKLRERGATTNAGGGGGGGGPAIKKYSAKGFSGIGPTGGLSGDRRIDGLSIPEYIGKAQELNATIIDTRTIVSDLMQDMQSQWGDTIAEFIKGGQSFGDFMSGMFENVLDSFSRMVGEMASKWMVSSLMGSLFGAATSVSGGGNIPGVGMWSMPKSTSIVINAVDAQSFDDALRRNAASVTNIVYESQHYGRAS